MSLSISVISALIIGNCFAAPAAPTASPSPSLPSAPPPVGSLTPQIVSIAGASVPNVAVPLKLTPAAQTGFQLLLWLEELEVYLYYEGLKNLTNQWSDQLHSYPNDTVEVITKTAAQEDIHVTTLNEVLVGNNVTLIPPCKYRFPASSPYDFFAISNIVTPTNFGSIIGLESQIGGSDPVTLQSSLSILATEVRHEVFLRSTVGEIPNPAPFDTGIPPAWGYNIGLEYIVPGSCPVEIDLPTYPRLYPSPNLGPRFADPATYPTSMNLTWDPAQDWVAREGSKPLYVAWLNLANQPIYTNLTRTGNGSGTTTVPTGLQNTAFIALTQDHPNNLDDLADGTLAGPLAVPIS